MDYDNWHYRYQKTRNAIKEHVDEDDTLKWGVTDSLGRKQTMTLLNRQIRKQRNIISSVIFMKAIEPVENFNNKKFQKTFSVNKITFAMMMFKDNSHKRCGRHPKVTIFCRLCIILLWQKETSYLKSPTYHFRKIELLHKNTKKSSKLHRLIVNDKYYNKVGLELTPNTS